MGKDLRTHAVELKLHRVPKIDGTPWNLRHVQPFFPTLETLFKTEQLSNLPEYGIKLPEEIESVQETTVKTTKGRTVPVHRKTTMLLSPFKTMKGEYLEPSMPRPSEVAQEMESKIQSPHTAAYVGALTSIVLSQSGCDHFPRVFGVYAAVSSSHEIDISDDYEDLVERKWFTDQMGKTFTLRLRAIQGESEFSHTRGHRQAIELGDDVNLEVDDVDVPHVDTPKEGSVVDEYEETSSVETGTSEASEEDVFDIQSCDCPDSDSEGECEEGEAFAWATFKDVPVVTTAMEVCAGTFYDLIKEHSEPEKQTAWMFQVVAALAYAQRYYGFVHNDLHGNNVMYVPTATEFLYYTHGTTTYKVPTYGYLMKIIDFDRAGISVRLTGMKEPRAFLSSQFQEDEEAGGQYNCEPYYNQKRPHIGLASSFDLARFATAVFWDIFPEGPDHAYDHPLFDMFLAWTTLPDGSSVMFRKKRDNHDRYHGFDLYKAIARYLKDSAVPRKELGKFKMFQGKIPSGEPFLVIET